MNIRYKLLLTLLVGAAFSAVILPHASANTMQVTMNYGSRHSGSGGEFNASGPDFVPATMGYTANTIVNGGFETFCVEENEYFNPGSTYYYAISQGAINGGVGGGNPDPVSLGTAWLYLHFAQGNLAGYTYTTGAGGDASAADLQATIWWLEGEQANNPNNTFSNAVITQFGSAAGAMADNNGFYGVGVLNLWGDIGHTQLAQDQLVLIPGVPDGGTTAILLGFGLLGLFLFNRKVSRRQAAGV